MFNIGQRTAVEGAFRLAGYEGPLWTVPMRLAEASGRIAWIDGRSFHDLHRRVWCGRYYMRRNYYRV